MERVFKALKQTVTDILFYTLAVLLFITAFFVTGSFLLLTAITENYWWLLGYPLGFLALTFLYHLVYLEEDESKFEVETDE